MSPPALLIVLSEPVLIPCVPTQSEVPEPQAKPSGSESPEVRPETTVEPPLSAPPAMVIAPPEVLIVVEVEVWI